MGGCRGFSAIELIIVVAILAIVSTVAIPSFIHQSNESKLRDAVSMLRGDLESARSRAVRENASVAVLFNAGAILFLSTTGRADGFRTTGSATGTSS